MIAWLQGTVKSRDLRSVVLDVNGVGYLINATPSVITEAEIGSQKSYHTYLHVSETSQDLYGFNTGQELSLFKQLISVSGVGPRSALSVLSAGTPAQVTSAIIQNNTAFLTSAPGVGRKTAERISVELRDKLTLPADDGTLPGDDEAVVEALVGLGYKQKDVREVLRGLTSVSTDPSARLKEALQKLSNAKWS
jgi:holliday junction DNA helicase RuvA